jgi:hypothetical protein
MQVLMVVVHVTTAHQMMVEPEEQQTGAQVRQDLLQVGVVKFEQVLWVRLAE